MKREINMKLSVNLQKAIILIVFLITITVLCPLVALAESIEGENGYIYYLSGDEVPRTSLCSVSDSVYGDDHNSVNVNADIYQLLQRGDKFHKFYYIHRTVCEKCNKYLVYPARVVETNHPDIEAANAGEMWKYKESRECIFNLLNTPEGHCVKTIETYVCKDCGYEYDHVSDKDRYDPHVPDVNTLIVSEDGITSAHCSVEGCTSILFNIPSSYFYGYTEEEWLIIYEEKLYDCIPGYSHFFPGISVASSVSPSSAPSLSSQVTCSHCGKSYCFIQKHHTYQNSTTIEPTCETAGEETKKCRFCGDKTSIPISPKGHVYDYSHPENTSAYTIRFPCIYGCAGAYDTHSHSFVDAGEDAVKTDNLQKSNDTHHKRRYDIRQVCNSKLGNGAICGAPNWRYDWRNENHSFANNGSEVKTSTLKTLNASQHERKYTQAKKCACGQSTTVETWKKESHSFANNGSEVKTSTLRTLNASQHERKYTQAKKCACDQSTTVETWKKENHSFANNGSEVKTSTLRTLNASQHERKYTQAQKCACGQSTTVETWKKENHSFANNGSEVKKTSTLRTLNASQHERKYTQAQKCACGQSTTVETWKKENHSFANNGSEVKTSTLRTLNASQHERKYTQAKKCACGQSTTVETWKKENHSFANNGSEVKTSTLRKLNASQHERKYTQAQKCACGQSTTVETWKKETHTFVNNGSEAKTNTTRTVNASQHERKYTQAQKCTCGETKTVEKWYKETHSWHNDAVSKVATCTAQGSRTRMCAVCNYVDTYPTAIDPNNHNWSGEPKCLTGASCTNGCGATKPALGHNYSGWTLVRTPTATDRGQLKRTCYRCGQVHYKAAR